MMKSVMKKCMIISASLMLLFSGKTFAEERKLPARVGGYVGYGYNYYVKDTNMLHIDGAGEYTVFSAEKDNDDYVLISSTKEVVPEKTAFLKFDISEVLDNVSREDVRTVRLRLATAGNVGSGKDLKAYLLPAEYVSYSEKQMCWAYAANFAGKSMLGDKSCKIFDKSNLSPNEVYTSDINMWPFLEEYMENSDKTEIAIRVETESAGGFSIMGTGAGQTTKPVLIFDIYNRDEECVKDAINYLKFDVISDNEQAAVMDNLNLPTSYNGANIEWSVSDAQVIDVLTGEVCRSDDSDKSVTLTARISTGSSSDIVEFDLTVLKNSIRFEMISNQKQDAVTENLNMLSLSENNESIEWESDNEAVVNSSTGEITRGEEHTVVHLTAKLKKDGVIRKRVFEITVLKLPRDIEKYLEEALSDIVLETNVYTSDFKLPTLIDKQVAVSWTTADSYELSISGGDVKLIRPRSKDLRTTLTAKAEFGGKSKEKTFDVIIPRMATNDLIMGKQVLSSDKNAAYAIDDDSSSVWELSGDRTLIVDMGGIRSVAEFFAVTKDSAMNSLTIEGSNDTYEWSVISTAASAQPNMGYYITLEKAVGYRYLRFTIPQEVLGIRQLSVYAVASDVSGGTNPLDSVSIPESVNADFELPAQASGNTISWTSSDTAAVSISGNTAKVTRGSSNVRVVVSASVMIDSVNYTKDFYITVEKISSSGSGGGSSSGGGTSSGGAYSLPLEYTGEATENTDGENSVFSDLYKAEWAREYIMHLYEKGIVAGYENGEFAPLNALKREEFASIASNAFGVVGEADMNFSDVSEQGWYYSSVMAMYSNNFMYGIDNTIFGIGECITREDAAVIIARILTEKGVIADERAETFTDDEDIAGYAADYVYMLKSLGIVNGDENGNFNPKKSINRAEAARIICDALKY